MVRHNGVVTITVMILIERRHFLPFLLLGQCGISVIKVIFSFHVFSSQDRTSLSKLILKHVQ